MAVKMIVDDGDNDEQADHKVLVLVSDSGEVSPNHDCIVGVNPTPAAPAAQGIAVKMDDNVDSVYF